MWKADPSLVSPKEVVGRRTFSAKLRNKHDQVLIDHFLDDRLNTDLSFDRLGLKMADAEVVTFLTPKADAHAEQRSRRFFGWWEIQVADLKELCVKPSPDLVNENPYHADLVRDAYREKRLAETLAFRLAYLARQFVTPIRAPDAL